MSRIPPAASEIITENFGPDASPTLRVYAQAPKTAQAVLELGRRMYATDSLPFRLIELVRLRIAFHNQCRVCMTQRYVSDDGSIIDESLVCSLERPQEAEDLNDAERAALRLADVLATNHLDADDELFARLRQHYSDTELLELCFRIAYFVGFGRMNAVLDVDPAKFDLIASEAGGYAPWRRSPLAGM